MKTAVLFATVILSLFRQKVEVVASFSDNTYPYEQIDKYKTADYACWYSQCTYYIGAVKDVQAAALSKWDELKSTLWSDSEVVKQFARLETMFDNSNYFNLSQCIQDFDQVLTLQKAVYSNVFNICLAEATKQNILDYVTNMTGLINIIIHLDADTNQEVYQCGSDNECKQNVESSALSQLTYEENRATVLADWYERKMLFDNVHSVRECVEFKTFEQVGDVKKIVNTVRNCLIRLFNIREDITRPLT